MSLCYQAEIFNQIVQCGIDCHTYFDFFFRLRAGSKVGEKYGMTQKQTKETEKKKGKNR